MADKSLRKRCRKFLDKLQLDAITRTGSPVDDLLGFVLAERGRAAAQGELDTALPLVLYFPTEEDRDEMIAVIKEVKPNLRARPVP